MLLFSIEKLYIFCANLDELEVIFYMDLFKMIDLNPNLNLIQISLNLNAHNTYNAFYIKIDDYYTFHLNSVLNDDCKALFGTDYIYQDQLATKYVRMKMIRALDMFYFSDLFSGL